MVFIFVSSRYIGAITFVLLDVLIAWYIFRGLQVLQGVYFYWRGKQGHRIPIARSRIPFISGELLQGCTKFPSIFVICNALVLILLCLGALGVNGETRTKYIPIQLSNVTNISSGTRLMKQNIPLEYQLRPASFGCSSRNLTTVTFWPLAFNITTNSNRAVNMTCQQNDDLLRPNFVSPLLRARCVPLQNQSCSLNSVMPDIHFNATFRLESNRSFIEGETATVYTISNTSSRMSQFSHKQGRAILYDKMSSFGWRRAVVMLNDPESNHFFMGYATVSEASGKLVMNPPVQVSPSWLALPNSTFFEALLLTTDASMRANGHVITRVLESLIAVSSTAKPLRWQAYRTSLEEGTEFTRTAVFVYSLLIVFAFALCVAEHMLIPILTYKWNAKLCELRPNDIDQFSKSVQRSFERLANIEPTNQFMSFGSYTDVYGVPGIGLVVPSSENIATNRNLVHASTDFGLSSR